MPRTLVGFTRRQTGRGFTMKLEYLKEFVTLAQSSNFHTGAKDLYISCATLSNHIRALEEEIGFKLFWRKDGNTLTKSGSLFLEESKNILEIVETGLEKCRASGNLSRHADATVNVQLRNSVNELCPMLEAHCPVKYSYVEYAIKRPFFYSFAQGLADVMVTYSLDILPSIRQEAEALGLRYEPYGHIPCAIVVEKKSVLAKEPLTRDRLRGAEIIQLDAVEADAWRTIISELLGYNLDFKFRLIPVSNTMNFRLIDLEGAAFVSLRPMLDQFFSQRSDLVVRGLVDGEPLLLPRSLVYRDPLEKPGIAEVVQTFRDHLTRS